MKCSDIKTLLSDYLAENLDDRVSGRVEEHLHECQECLRRVTQMREMIGTLNEAPPVLAPPDFLQRVRAAKTAKGSSSGIFQKLFLPMKIKVPVQVAAMAILAVIIFHVVATEDLKKASMPGKAPMVTVREPSEELEVSRDLDEISQKRQPTDRAAGAVGESKLAPVPAPASSGIEEETPVSPALQEPSPAPMKRAKAAFRKKDVMELVLTLKDRGAAATPAPFFSDKPDAKIMEPEADTLKKEEIKLTETAPMASRRQAAAPAPPLEREAEDLPQRLSSLITDHGGQILTSTWDGPESLNLKFSIPAPRLESFIQRLSALGTLEPALAEKSDVQGSKDETVVVRLRIKLR